MRRSFALAALALAACADAPPPDKPRQPPAPMVTPQPPSSSPLFNAANATPLPVPDAPAFKSTAMPASPGPLAALTPLPQPEPLSFGTEAVPEPGPPAQRAKPMPRPGGTSAPPRIDDAALPGEPPPTPPAAVGDPGVADGFRLLFAPGSAELPAAASALLREIADALGREPSMRLKILAYASGEADNPVPARRLSLQRALKVREALAGEGIASLRIDVLALGLGATAPPLDRVDLVPIR